MWQGADEYYSDHNHEIPDKKIRACIGKTKAMTIQELRKEFPFGNLCCCSWAGTLLVYIKMRRNLLATIYTELQKNGSLKIVSMAIVMDQEGSKPLVVIAEREKIPQEILTKAILKQIADSY